MKSEIVLDEPTNYASFIYSAFEKWLGKQRYSGQSIN